MADGSNKYLDQVYFWWNTHYPGQIKLVNAGISATGSAYGAFRTDNQIISENPDLVLIDFAVNDLGVDTYMQTMEGIVRKVANTPKNPLILFVNFMTQDGATLAKDFSKLAEYYDVLQVNYGAQIKRLVASQKIAFTDVFSDWIHPNNLGHNFAGHFINRYFEKVYFEYKKNPSPVSFTVVDSKAGQPRQLPAPLISDEYQYTVCLNNQNSSPQKIGSQSPSTYNRGCGGGWILNQPGSELVFSSLKGASIGILIRIERTQNNGIAEVSVDKGPPVKIDSYWPKSKGPWPGPAYSFFQISTGLNDTSHDLRIKLISEVNSEISGSKKVDFEVLNVFVSGSK